jgi:flagellar basal-body rod modification protein FlgD
MIQVVQGPVGPAAASPPPPATTGKGNQNLGKDDFLRLLITQLRYQDPINPSKPEEFASQLAQFSSLEGMQNIQELLQRQLEAGALSTLAMKADLGASFIGRNVLAAGNHLEVTGGGTSWVSVDIGTGGGKAVLTIYDASGRQVATKDLGFRNAGRQVLETPELPTGSYTYSVTATSLSGADINVQTYTSGIIDGVSFSGGRVVLRSGSLEFSLDNVVEVERAPAGAAALAAVTNARILPSPTE